MTHPTAIEKLLAEILMDLACHPLMALLVPPAGIEPALPKEPHFECGASTNSAKGADPKINCMIPQHMKKVLEEIKLPFGWGLEAVADLLIKDASFEGPHEWEDEASLRGLMHIRGEACGSIMVRVTCADTIDNMTGEPMEGWNGRWWRLSQHMTPGEIVQTVFKAVMTALEHEARELFLYKGVSVLDPHFDIDKMVEYRKDPSSILGRS